MTAVFGEKERKDAFATKRRLLVGWFVVLGIYLAAEVAMAVTNGMMISRTRSRALYIPFMAISITLGILFSCGSLFFFEIKYKLTSRYCRMLRGMQEGLRERSHGTFIEIDPTISEKDGVFFYSLVLDCPPIKRGDITERKVLVERTHSLPALSPGDRINFITHANILVAYEIHSAGVFDDLTDEELSRMESEEFAFAAGGASAEEERKINESGTDEPHSEEESNK